jgi:hypothetical protein
LENDHLGVLAWDSFSYGLTNDSAFRFQISDFFIPSPALDSRLRLSIQSPDLRDTPTAGFRFIHHFSHALVDGAHPTADLLDLVERAAGVSPIILMFLTKGKGSHAKTRRREEKEEGGFP